MLRGNERRNIFHDEEDRLKFLETLRRKKQLGEFYLYSFCLMDNHVHLMIKEATENIAKIMKRITVSYAMNYNNKYKRVGHLFHDRFQSECIEDDNYVFALIKYIHYNPVKAGLTQNPADYKWSSYKSYLDEEHYSDIIDINFILALFSTKKSTARKLYREYMKQESAENFIDIEEDTLIDEMEGRAIWEKMLKGKGINLMPLKKGSINNDIIYEFQKKTKLSARKISNIININKDRVNKAIREAELQVAVGKVCNAEDSLKAIRNKYHL